MKKSSAVSATLFLSLGLAGCATTVRTESGHGHGGIPYYLPKAVLVVKEPIETKRAEKLFAIVQIGGLNEFLYPMDKDLDKAIKELRQLTLNEKTKLKFVPLTKELSFLTERTDNIDDSSVSTTGEHQSENKTKKNDSTQKYSAIASSPTANTYALRPADIAKSYEVVLVPDINKPFEVFIDNRGIVNSKVDVTISDGWKLTSIGVTSDPTAIITALGSIVGTAIGAQKEVRVAEITAKQALDLERLKQQGAGSTAGQAQAAVGKGYTETSFSIIGYTREVSISSIRPGVYSLDDPSSLSFNYDSSVIYQPISF